MSEKKKKKLSVFELATRDHSIHASLGVEEVRQFRPEWTRAKVEEWLNERDAAIAKAMMEGGMVRIIQELAGDHSE